MYFTTADKLCCKGKKKIEKASNWNFALVSLMWIYIEQNELKSIFLTIFRVQGFKEKKNIGPFL